MEDNVTLLKKISDLFSKQEGLDDLLVMCEHWDGYKRENAVRRLGMLGNPIAIPKLIVRANDWVPQVRIAAKEAIVNLASPNNSEAFVLCLPDLYHLRKCGRDDHDSLIQAIESFLLLEANTRHLVGGLYNDNPFVARICMTLVIDNQILDVTKLAREGLQHPDIIVRAKASHLIRGLAEKDQKVMLDIAICDRFMPIRREAFQILLKSTASEELARTFLFDRHSSIREIAIRHLDRSGVDVKACYVESLTAEKPALIRLSIWGLGELKASDYLPVIKGHLNSKFPGIRKQSISSISKIIDDESKDVLIGGLSDESPSVSKESARLIARHKIMFSSDDLLDVVSLSSLKHTVLICIGICKRINKWERLIFLISLFSSKHKERFNLEEVIDLELRLWNDDFNRSSSQPTTKQIAILSQVYSRSQSAIELNKYRSIKFTLESFGI